MNKKRLVAIGLTAIVVTVPAVGALAAGSRQTGPTLIDTVREATQNFQDPNNATGYASTGNCVSSPEEGAMGIHYANPDLIGDGLLDGSKPELLLYEQRHGKLELLGVEFIVFAAQWNDPAAGNPPGAPVLQGQLFNYVPAPNRYGLDAFYELHVWAWRDNPKGSFADFNPKVKCDQYAGEASATPDHGG
jgi:hypothetical protein